SSAGGPARGGRSGGGLGPAGPSAARSRLRGFGPYLELLGASEPALRHLVPARSVFQIGCRARHPAAFIGVPAKFSHWVHRSLPSVSLLLRPSLNPTGQDV